MFPPRIDAVERRNTSMIQPRRSGEYTDISGCCCYCICLEDREHPLFVVFFCVGTSAGFGVMGELEVGILLRGGEGFEMAREKGDGVLIY